MVTVAAFTTTSFVGLLLSGIVLSYYIGRINSIEAKRLPREFRRYYKSLAAASIAVTFTFIALFMFTWTTNLFAAVPAWIRLALDGIALAFLVLSIVHGKRMVREMVRIQKEHGL